jgi:DNA primase
MIYDPDDAGQMATLRSLDIFLEEEMNVKVVSLPEGFDPDLFVREVGIAALKERIEKSQDLFDYKLMILKARYDIKDALGKTKVASEMLPTISRYKNAILKAEYIKRLAAELNTEEQNILEELKKVQSVRPYVSLSVEAPKRISSISPAEKLLIKLMLEEAESLKRIREVLEPADFQNEITSRIASIMFDLAGQGKTVEPRSLINYFGEETISQLICESTLLPEISLESRDRVIDDCVMRLKSEKLRLKKQHLHELIETAQSSGDDEKLHLLIEEFNNLTKIR